MLRAVQRPLPGGEGGVGRRELGTRQLALRQRARVDHAEPKDAAPSASGCDAQAVGRRSLALAAAAAAVSALRPLSARADAASPPPTDIVEGTQRWADLGIQAIGAQLQQAAGGGDEEADAALQERRRRFGVVTVPGLSSFSFIHGMLVGTAAIAFVWTLGNGGSSGSSSDGGGGSGGGGEPAKSGQAPPALDPQLADALRAALADAGETFHDPAVHEAVEDVRRDIANISKYRDNPNVMAAFSKLLEIEGILERL
ncbi:hypothetical protein Rsub_05130 [Raphidocelis subcapitata]|uniref:STI1/HOP DP domain-containing protein n=1 Tax=Raphidocelis subcapitata TaxID=307507 RepID=A0A2V0NYP7_9CHLO|nr:hypothetical protein Rsub_05130 [Raphidocelis subcapitata]|eukprot:GBF92761.1 hypothetical protein Rsub_05130 [Raphidocelis subcapitata]